MATVNENANLTLNSLLSGRAKEYYSLLERSYIFAITLQVQSIAKSMMYENCQGFYRALYVCV